MQRRQALDTNLVFTSKKINKSNVYLRAHRRGLLCATNSINIFAQKGKESFSHYRKETAYSYFFSNEKMESIKKTVPFCNNLGKPVARGVLLMKQQKQKPLWIAIRRKW